MKENYQLKSEEIVERFQSSLEEGLCEKEVKARIEKYGLNELKEKAQTSLLKMVFEQISETMVLILLVAALISFVLSKWLEGFSILAIVILFTILGIRQNYRAEKAMAALKKMSKPLVRVKRDSQVVEIDSSLLVPGDLVYLENGNMISADCRIIEAINLKVQEATLTGESEAVEKETAAIFKDNVPLGDRKNMLYMGTIVTYGRATAMVVETGMRTELGKIAVMLQSVKKDITPLQKRLDNVGKTLAIIGGIIAVLLGINGLLKGEKLIDMFLLAISVAVAIVPEGLPAVVMITLAIGAKRMLDRNALIRKLPAVETLGSVTDICSDKTGTLTQNKMTVTALLSVDTPIGELATKKEAGQYIENSALKKDLLLCGMFCNDALLNISNQGEVSAIGDPTEGALIIAALQDGFMKKDLEHRMPRILEYPFDSERKRMTTVHHRQEGFQFNTELLRDMNGKNPFVSFTKGSVDGLLTISKTVVSQGQIQELSASHLKSLESLNAALAENGIRVLGLCCKFYPEKPDFNHVEQDLTFLGLVGMIDPARPEVKDAVALCRSAGINPIMITGDHPLTASFIARDIGITHSKSVITGVELAKFSDEELEKIVLNHNVFARVSPEHKLRIVKALQKQGKVVSMTGDGVNDAPALKQADIGVAMGITGTDVTKEASDMVLRDDNFATIVAAVKEGRVIYDNIRKFVKYSVAGNLGKVLTMILVPLAALLFPQINSAGLTIPLFPLQLLWLNLLTDGLLGVGLGVEASESHTMKRPPIPKNKGVFSDRVGFQVMHTGILIALLCTGFGIWHWYQGNPNWQTLLFTSLAFAQVFQALGTRSFRDSFIKIGIRSNPLLLQMVGITLLLQTLAVYLPFFNYVLDTKPLAVSELLFTLLFTSPVFMVAELEKYLIRRRKAH